MIAIAGTILRDKDGRYLLVQERKESAYGLWGLPAGWVDDGETPKQAAIRETKEEVGLDIEIDSNQPFYDSNQPEADRHYYAFLGKIKGGVMTIQSEELLAAQWHSFEVIEVLYAQEKIRAPWVFLALEKAENAYSGD